jgi:hypothetical protein
LKVEHVGGHGQGTTEPASAVGGAVDPEFEMIVVRRLRAEGSLSADQERRTALFRAAQSSDESLGWKI